MYNELKVENARIIFRNFSGKEGSYNPAGRRNFCLVLSPEQAYRLREEGWNVKSSKMRDALDEPEDYVQINVNYDSDYPPRIVMIKNGKKKVLEEDELVILDWAEIENVDMIISPYPWNLNGRTGIKGYLKIMYITIAVDELEEKYADVPDYAQASFMAESEE